MIITALRSKRCGGAARRLISKFRSVLRGTASENHLSRDATAPSAARGLICALILVIDCKKI